MPLALTDLLDAVSAGGPSALSSVTPLRPAAGAHAVVAPAKFASSRGNESIYAYDVRYVDGEPQRTVLIDSSQSQSNRIESALDLAIRDDNSVLGRIPSIRVTYECDGVTEEYTDLTLPHRAFDAHIRAGSVDGTVVTALPQYRAARDATPLNARALLDLSPVSLVLGSWDSSRKSRQGRWASAVTGEIIGTLTDQGGSEMPHKGGARVDPVGMSIQVDGPTLLALAEAQKNELSPKTFADIAKKARGLKTGETTSASALGFGGIPPALSQLGGVSCAQIIRSRVLSFATLRQLRFGSDARGDAALRAVLAALAINGIVRADAELYLRAHCHLVEDGPTRTEIDRRHGQVEHLELPDIEEADALLAEALDDAAAHAGLDWHGQVLEVQGSSKVLEGREDDSAGGEG